MTKNHLFYGSLKQNKYNFDRFGSGSQKFIKTLKLKGFKMYDLGHYPCVVEGDGEITVELHEVNDESAAKNIYFMEKGAGYLWKDIEIDGEKARIYYITAGRLNDEKRYNNQIKEIPSGEWVG